MHLIGGENGRVEVGLQQNALLRRMRVAVQIDLAVFLPQTFLNVHLVRVDEQQSLDQVLRMLKLYLDDFGKLI